MILYKYCGFDAGKKIIENNTIGFRQPHFFNDPFESAASYPRKETGDPLEDFVTEQRHQFKKQIWTTNYAVLSLTRSPLNPLMWAHYAKSHQGFVVGLDVNIEDFTSEQKNAVPIQFGNVIYTESKPTHEYLTKFKIGIEVGTTVHFVPEQLEKLQRVFLYKPMCWSYEEEVRIVKCIHGVKEGKPTESGRFEVIQSKDGLDLFVMKLPQETIKEIYLGIRNTHLREHDSVFRFRDTVARIHPNCKVFGCRVGKTAWEIDGFQIDQADVLFDPAGE